MNNWLTILQAFREGEFPQYYYGLTPRFLIGATQIPIGQQFDTPELAYSATEEMFNEMQYFNEGGLIVVANNCGIHNGPVMSLAERSWSENSIQTSFEEIWLRYGEEIVFGDYHFSRAELATLNKIFGLD